MPKPKPDKSINSYVAIISRIFVENYRVGLSEFVFARKDMATVVESLKIDPPKNYGDVVYTFRYREALPESVRATAMPGFEWIIEGAGRSKYRFKQVRLNRIVPRDELLAIKVPDATPEIIGAYALSDEQALLAKVRYNRLIDIFLGIAAFSLQNHLRTTVKNVGQIEIDEVYVGIDRHGRQFVVPVQAKGGSDKHGSVQTQQDILCCAEKFPDLICRAVSAQFMDDDRIAMFELALHDGEIRVVDEKHYRLVPSSEITANDLRTYGSHIS
jgi:hypothetical protein